MTNQREDPKVVLIAPDDTPDPTEDVELEGGYSIYVEKRGLPNSIWEGRGPEGSRLYVLMTTDLDELLKLRSHLLGPDSWTKDAVKKVFWTLFTQHDAESRSNHVVGWSDKHKCPTITHLFMKGKI